MSYRIVIKNRLPYSLQAEFQSDLDQAMRMLKEEGFGGYAAKFIDSMLEGMKPPLGNWSRFEGYFKHLNKHHTLLAVCGGIYLADINQILFRSMLVRHVPPNQLVDTENALGLMFMEYLDQLEIEKMANEEQAGNGHTFGSGKSVAKCSICGVIYQGYGNNAYPVNTGRCCDRCNQNAVIPARMESIERMRRNRKEQS